MSTGPGAASTGLLLGIDCGQSLSKAALFDLRGHEVAVASVSTLTVHPRPHWVEHEMDEMWAQLAGAVRAVLRQAGPDTEILAVGVCGHNDGLYAVDAALRPVRPAILATDSRANRYAATSGGGEAGRAALARTGQVPFSGSPAALYAWLRDEEPEAYARVRWVLSAKDWVRLRLTGAVGTDPSEASASFTDVATQQWSVAALDLYGLGDLQAALPPILGSAEVAGRVGAAAAAATGLREGTPVATGAHDVDAAAIGIGAAFPGATSVVMGTFNINQILCDRPVSDPRWQARSFVRPGQWLHMCTSAAGASSLDWAVRLLGPHGASGEPDFVRAVREAGASADRDNGPMFLPYLYGSPVGHASAATWADLRGWHSRGAALHAVLEGVVFAHRRHLEMLREAFDLGATLRACGGGARSGYWTQLLADAVRLPVEVTDADQAGSRGAALLAGVAIGAFADLDTAIQRCVAVARTFTPDPARAEVLDRRYRRFRHFESALHDLELDDGGGPR